MTKQQVRAAIPSWAMTENSHSMQCWQTLGSGTCWGFPAVIIGIPCAVAIFIAVCELADWWR